MDGDFGGGREGGINEERKKKKDREISGITHGKELIHT